MSQDRVDKLEQSVRSLRRRLDETVQNQWAAFDSLRYAVLAAALSGALLVLTATTWRTVEQTGGEESATLWGMVPDGWQAAWTLIGVLTVAIGTLGVFFADTAGRATYVVFTVLCLITAVGTVLVGEVERPGWYDPDDVYSAPGRWLTLLVTLALGAVHGSRVRESRR